MFVSKPLLEDIGVIVLSSNVKLQSTLAISKSDISNYAKLKVSIQMKKTS